MTVALEYSLKCDMLHSLLIWRVNIQETLPFIQRLGICSKFLYFKQFFSVPPKLNIHRCVYIHSELQRDLYDLVLKW